MSRTVARVRKPVVLFVLFFVGLGCLLAVWLSSSDSQPWAGPIPEEAPSDPDDPARRLPVAFTIKERAGLPRPDGLVEAGVPFAVGEVAERLELCVSDDGRALPASFAPLAWWPDGSVRWAKMPLPVALAAGETKHYVPAKGEGPALVVNPPNMPDTTLRLVTGQRTATFPVRSSGRIALWVFETRDEFDNAKVTEPVKRKNERRNTSVRQAIA